MYIPETAAHNIDGCLYHIVGWDPGLLVARVGSSFVWQIKNPIELLCFQRYRRRIYPKLFSAMFLHQNFGVIWIGLLVENSGCMRIKNGIICNFIKGGQSYNFSRDLSLLYVARVGEQFLESLAHQ